MTKIAAMPIYGKNLKKFLLQNQKADDLETWFAASAARVPPNLFKWWPILRQVQIWSLMRLYGKKEKQLIFQKLLSSII